ncbi:MAG: GNAT family N-acetyltransferase [Bauldia sp.]|uniref:GNAT family N-acetyltransferase n=1 Tax=Bauldia sp. TaxID=2575872 RepID=UPI001E035EB2|nr:GNAT family N-acetyltransferase [Bauldia sp.]MCB1494456.1 GNAT family N-acetyltransferase [Bauldia sp.]
MAEANPTFGLRPMLPEDGPALAEIYRESIAELTGDDYDPAQQEAWAASADDEEAFTDELAGQLTLVAVFRQSPVGFASLDGNERIAMLFVHPAVARQGIATMLVDALEKLAAGRGAARLTTEASDTARPFFAGRGYVAERRETVIRVGEWLGRTVMAKQLGDDRGAGA